MDPMTALTMQDDEKSCMEHLLNSTDLRTALKETSWVPKSPVELKHWIPLVEKLIEEIQRLLQKHPAVHCTSNEIYGPELGDVEDYIVELLQFLTKLLSWSSRRRLASVAFAESLLGARNERVMMATIVCLNVYCGVSFNYWKHRSFANMANPSSDTFSLVEHTSLKDRLTLIATYEGPSNEKDIESDAEDDSEDDDEQPIPSRQQTPACGIDADSSLRESRRVLDAVPSTLSLGDRFKLLLAERRRASKDFFIRARVIIAPILDCDLKGVSRAQLMRDACSVLFQKLVHEEHELHSATYVIQKLSQDSRKLVFHSLASRIPGRGDLIESVRSALAEADTDPETKMGLSFTRAAEKRTTRDFLLRLEMDLVLCGVLAGRETGAALLVDGGVVRAIISWLERALIDETDDDDAGSEVSEDYEAQCSVLSAGCWFYSLLVTNQSSLVQPTEEGETWIKACLRLVHRIIQRPSPCFPERTLLCALIQTILLTSQAARRASTSSSAQDRLPPFLLTSDDAAIKDLLVLLLENAKMIGGSAVRLTAELLNELIRGITLDTVLRGPIGVSLLSFVEHLSSKCPTEDTEALYAVPKYIWPLIRKSSYGRAELTKCSPFAVFFSCLRNPRFFPALSGFQHSPYRNVGHALTEFLQDALDTSTQFVKSMEDAINDLQGIPDENVRAIAVGNTLKCISDVVMNRDVSKQFIERGGIGMLLKFVAPKDGQFSPPRKLLELINSAIRGGLALTSRKETLEAFSGVIVNEVKANLSQMPDSYLEWLTNTMGRLVEASPRYQPRSGGGLFSSDVVMDALDELARWDARNDRVTQCFADFVKLVAKSNKPPSSSLMMTTSVRGRMDPKIVSFLAKVVETTLSDALKKEFTLTRAHIVLKAARESEDGVKQLLTTFSASGTHRQLLKLTIEAMEKPYHGNLVSELLSWLLTDVTTFLVERPDRSRGESGEREFTVKWLDLAMFVAEQLTAVELTKCSDAAIIYMLKSVGNFLSTKDSWRPPKPLPPQVEEQSRKPEREPAFEPDPQVVGPLMDMGFHVAHIQDAQERLKSNDVQVLTLHLLENPRPVSDEDEIKLALWLSIGETSSKQEEEEAKPKEVEPSAEELEQKRQLDAVEEANIRTISKLMKHVVEACGRLGTRRPTIQIPLELVQARAAPAARTEISMDPRVHLWTILYVNNDSDEVFRIQSSHTGKQTSLLVNPHSVVSFHTYCGSRLKLERVNVANGESTSFGTLVMPFHAFAQVVIPSGFQSKAQQQCVLVECEPLMFSRFRIPRESVQPDFGSGRPPVLFVNDTNRDVEIRPTGIVDEDRQSYGSQESFIVRAGETVERPLSSRELAWHASTLPMRDRNGLFVVPNVKHLFPRFLRRDAANSSADPDNDSSSQFVVSLMSMIPNDNEDIKIFTTAAESLQQWIALKLTKEEEQESTEGLAELNALFLENFKDSPCLMTAVLTVSEQRATSPWHAWIESVGLNKLFETIMSHLVAPVYVHRSPKREEDEDLKTSRSSKKRMAAEAMLQSPQESSGMEPSHKLSPRKKRAVTVPLGPSMEDSPVRAQVILALHSLLVRKPSTVEIEELDDAMKKIAESIPVLNTFEMNGAFTLLGPYVTKYLSLKMIMESLHIHGFLLPAAKSIETLLHVPEDDMYKWRKGAYLHFQKQVNARTLTVTTSSSSAQPPPKPTAKISLDTFCNNVNIPSGKPEQFAQAMQGYLVVENDSVTDCRKPELDESSGFALAETFVELVETYFEVTSCTVLLCHVMHALPRVALAVARRTTLVQRIVEALFTLAAEVDGIFKQWAYFGCLVLRDCGQVNAEALSIIAAAIVEKVSSASFDKGRTFALALTLLRVSPRLVVECDRQHLTSAVLVRMEGKQAIHSRGFSELLGLFQFVVSRETREVVLKGVEGLEDDLTDSTDTIVNLIQAGLSDRFEIGGARTTHDPEVVEEIEEMMIMHEATRRNGNFPRFSERLVEHLFGDSENTMDSEELVLGGRGTLSGRETFVFTDGGRNEGEPFARHLTIADPFAHFGLGASGPREMSVRGIATGTRPTFIRESIPGDESRSNLGPVGFGSLWLSEYGDNDAPAGFVPAVDPLNMPPGAPSRRGALVGIPATSSPSASVTDQRALRALLQAQSRPRVEPTSSEHEQAPQSTPPSAEPQQLEEEKQQD